MASNPTPAEQLRKIADWITEGGEGSVREPDPDELRSIADEVEALEVLLRVARCPNDGCRDGAVPVQVGEGEWEAEQCQWCDERKEATETGGEGVPILAPDAAT